MIEKDSKEFKELKRMGKTELIELVLENEKENDRLINHINSLKAKIKENETNESEEMRSLKEKLESREIMLTEAGNIAEASLKLNNIFEIAQNTADEYLKNIKALSERQDEILNQREAKANERIKEMLEETKSTCEKMKKEAEEEVASKWEAFENRMSQFIEAHDGLREILTVMGK